jgi:hypothetical protein
MTWRPTKYLVEGELDNSVPGIIVGWLRFAGVDDKVSLELEGDFMSDIRGKRLTLSGRYEGSSRVAWKEMRGFRADQLGRAGWITAGGTERAAHRLSLYRVVQRGKRPCGLDARPRAGEDL